MPRAPSGPTNDDGDFTEFVQASWAGLYRTAFMLLGDRGLAEDLAQTGADKDLRVLDTDSRPFGGQGVCPSHPDQHGSVVVPDEGVAQ